jgi:hypothetical protein
LRLLTQAGQLTEATALLQWMFRGERAPGRAPPTIDLKANEVSKADPAAPAETPTVTPRRRRPLFDRAKDGTWLGLRGVKHAPASVTDIVPEGAKFIEGTYSNKVGSLTYKLFVPSGYQGHPQDRQDARYWHQRCPKDRLRDRLKLEGGGARPPVRRRAMQIPSRIQMLEAQLPRPNTPWMS